MSEDFGGYKDPSPWDRPTHWSTTHSEPTVDIPINDETTYLDEDIQGGSLGGNSEQDGLVLGSSRVMFVETNAESGTRTRTRMSRRRRAFDSNGRTAGLVFTLAAVIACVVYVNAEMTKGREDAVLGQADYPPQYQLLQVQFIVRHGARVPLVSLEPITTSASLRSPSSSSSSFSSFSSSSFKGSDSSSSMANVLDSGTTNAVSASPITWSCSDHELITRSRLIKDPRHVSSSNHRRSVKTLHMSMLVRKELVTRRSPRDSHASRAAARRAYSPVGCTRGQLTDSGVKSMLRIGKAIRERFVDKLKVVGSRFDPSEVYVRSTDKDRTKASMQAVMQSMYPRESRGSGEPASVMMKYMHSSEENMYPNKKYCRNLAEIEAEVMRSAGLGTDGYGERYASLYKEVKSLFAPSDAPEGSHVFVPSPKAIASSLRCFDAEGIEHPKQYNPDLVKRINEAASAYLNATTVHRRYLAHAIGDFVREIHDNMESIDQDDTPEASSRPFHLYSAHDSTVYSVLGALGAFKGKAWPPFASTLHFELFRERSGDDAERYFRIFYNKDPIILDGCDSEICNFQVLKDKVAAIESADCGAYEIPDDDDEH